MSETDANLRSELLFLIAKYLKSEFPDVGDIFINKCEELHLFPQRVFQKNSTFDQLSQNAFVGIPDDQLMRIASLAIPNSTFPSLLFSPTDSNSTISPIEIFSNKIQNPSPPLSGFSLRGTVVGHLDQIFCLAVDKTSQILITGSDDSRIKMWSIPSMILLRTLFYNRGVVSDLAIHPSNLYFAASSHDHTISLISMSNGVRVSLFLMKKEVHSVCFSPCGNYLAAACEEGMIVIWTFQGVLKSLPPCKIIPTPENKPAAWVNFSPGGEFLVFSSDPNNVIVTSLDIPSSDQHITSQFNMNSNEIQNYNKIMSLDGHTNLPDFVFFSTKTCSMIFSLSIKDRGFRIWQSPPMKSSNQKLVPWSQCSEIYPIEPGGSRSEIKSIHTNCDESKVIAINNSCIFIYHLQETMDENDSIQLLSIGKDPIYTDHCTVFATHPFLPDVAFFGTKNGLSSLWDLSCGQIITPLQTEPTHRINEVVWSPDGQNLFTADAAGGITIYNCFSQISPPSQQFLFQEINSGPGNDLIVDYSGIILDPQPPRVKLEDIKISLYQAPISSHIKKEEKQFQSLFDMFTSDQMLRAQMKNNKAELEDLDLDEDEDLASAIYDSYQRREEEDEEWNPSQNTLDDDINQTDTVINAYQDWDEIKREKEEKRMQKQKEREEKKRGKQRRQQEKIKKHRGERKQFKKEGRKHLHMENDDDMKNDDEEWTDVSSYSSSEDEKLYSSLYNNRDKVNFVYYSSDDDGYIKTRSSSNHKLSDDDDLIIKPRAHLKQVDYRTDESSEYLEDDSPVDQPRRSKVDHKSSNSENYDSDNNDDEFSNSKEPIVDILPEWTFATTRSQDLFIPQKGEIVFYSCIAHKDFCEDLDMNTFPPPFLVHPALPPVAFATIMDVEFFITSLALNLHFEFSDSFSFDSQILYQLPEAPPYLVPKDLYQVSMENTEQLKQGDILKVPFANENGKTEVFLAYFDSLKENWKEQPYNSLLVHFEDGSEEAISPWEVLQPQPSNSIMEEFLSSFENASGTILRNSKYQPFLALRSDEMNDLRLKNGIRPMDITLLTERTKNRFYRSIDELSSDVQLFVPNASFLGLDTQLAQELQTELLDTITFLHPISN